MGSVKSGRLSFGLFNHYKEEFMTMRITVLLTLIMIGAVACQPKPTPDTAGAAEVLEEQPPIAAPSTSEPEAEGAEESAAEKAKRALEQLDKEVACETVDDCAHSRMRVGSNGQCCRGCTARPVNQSAYEKQSAICDELGSEGCPMKKCAAPPTLACQEGKCVNLP